MALSTGQHQKLVDWLTEKGVKPECPACGAYQSFVPLDVVAAPVRTAGGLNVGDRMTPMVQMVCSHCAHVMLFAAEPMGVQQVARHGSAECNGHRK